MKVLEVRPHNSDVRGASATVQGLPPGEPPDRGASAPSCQEPAESPLRDAGLRDASQPVDLDFTTIYDAWFVHVLRWSRALGGRESDLEDLAQEVFVVVRRKLSRFDGRNLPGWLYKITRLTVRDHARRAWFRHLFIGREATDLDELPEKNAGPERALELRQNQLLFHRMIERMSPTRRETFVLFEVEGYSGDEIARMQGVPVNTVWTRLHHARKDFLAMVSKLPAEENGGRP